MAEESKVSKEQGIKRMLEYYEEQLNNGLTYNMHRFEGDTHDEEFNEAINDFHASFSVLEEKFSQFEDKLENGDYDDILG